MARACTVCAHPKLADLTKAIAAGGSDEQVAVRFDLDKAAVVRHRMNHLRMDRKRQPKGDDARGTLPGNESVKPLGAVRFDSQDPASLVATTARLVDEALGLLENAKRVDDRRTALSALREARDGLQLLMRASGMLAAESAGSVDARQVHMNLFPGWNANELRALIKALPATETETLAALNGQFSEKNAGERQ